MKSKISDLCTTMGSGGTPSRRNNEYYKDGSIRWLKTKELDDQKIYDTEEYISEDALINSSAKIYPINTVSMAMYGATVGKLGIMKNAMATNQACCNMVVDPIKADYRFLFYSLLLNRENLISLANGAAQQNLNKGVIGDFEIEYFEPQEQKAIAHILSTLDEKIEVNNKINKTLEEMAQAIFKHWFVDFEFPNEDGEPYKSSGGEMVNSELGPIPKGWVVGRISDISQRIYSGGTPRTNEAAYWQGNLPWMSSGETRNSFLISTEKRITELAVKSSSTKLALKYCTVIASAGQGMTRGQSTLLLIDTFVNQSIIVVQAKKGFEFYNFCNLSSRYDEMRGLSDSHSIRGSLTTKMISTMPILIPNENVLFTFNNVVIKIFEGIENSYYENKLLISIRDTLLPKLMSGEIRVPIENEQ